MTYKLWYTIRYVREITRRLQKTFSRRGNIQERFLRRTSYVIGVSAAFLVGAGTGLAINAARTDTQTIKDFLDSQDHIHEPSDTDVAIQRYTGMFLGAGTAVGGAIFAYVSYMLHRDNSTPPR